MTNDIHLPTRRVFCSNYRCHVCLCVCDSGVICENYEHIFFYNIGVKVCVIMQKGTVQ